MKQEVTIYTDGACSGNPGPGGYAAVILCGDSKKEVVGAKSNTTNNQMELTAAIEGLKALTKPCKVTLYSDSAYLVNAYNNKWIDSWKKKNWKTSSGEQVKNIELWQELEYLKELHDITYIKVKGHSDNMYNNRCDSLAVEAIKGLEKEKTVITVIKEDRIKEVFDSLPILETERLKLRLFTKEDACDLYEYASDVETTKYLTFDTYTTKEEAIKRLEYVISNYTKLKFPINWAIESKENNKMIGGIDFVKWDTKYNKGEIGFVLNKDYWNKGYMTEALKEVIKFGFNEMGLNRIEINCDERNIASSKVIEKNGLVYEGTEREGMLLKGEYVNVKKYSILKSEYNG